MEKINEDAIVFNGELKVSAIALPRIQGNYLEKCRDFELKDSLEKSVLYFNINCWPSAKLFADDVHTMEFRVIEDVFDYKPIQGILDKTIEEDSQTICGPFICVGKEIGAGNQYGVDLYKTNPVRDLPYTMINIFQYETVKPKLDESKFKVGQKYWVFIRKID